MSEVCRIRFRVEGVVQGVGFRESTRREAHRLGLSGWVRNHVDGSVEGEVEGPSDSIQNFTAWCRVGPPSASVVRLQTTPQDVTGEGSPFVVRR